MLGKIAGAIAGRSVARRLGGRAAGPIGVAAGVALPMILRRFGPLGMFAAAVGGYAFSKLSERYAGPDAK